MTLRDQLIKNEHLTFRDNLFEQRNIQSGYSEFQKRYETLRSVESRNYPDEFVRNLPEEPNEHPQKKDWTVRSNTLTLNTMYQQGMQKTHSVLEVVRGNAWLSHNLAKTEVCCIDNNRT
ncbi:MAG: hypothetical protein ABIS36_26380 [Chryseolinea sp.]